MKTTDLIKYLDNFLEIGKIPDASQNGLQVEGNAEISQIGVAVDACQDSIDAAVATKVDLLIVHHGLFWDRPEKLVGNTYRRVKTLIQAGINLYCAHLPLDWHPEVGNNTVLARRIGFEPSAGFGPSGAADGRCIGCIAQTANPINSAELCERLTTHLNGDLRADLFGAKIIKQIAIVTGGGSFLLPAAAAAGVEAFITGEPKHSYYHFARENHMNVIYGGHYATETFGVIALAERLQEKFGIPFQFFDFPTGL